MTHAFFKALLFMAAGSVIGAMANRQNIDLMGGFRKSLPFTCALLLIGAWRWPPSPAPRASSPRTRSSPSPSTAAASTGCSRSAATSARCMTAIYAFRIGFRVAFGEPVPGARELEQGHIPHAEPENPATGEPEDTDVGFPGEKHHDRRAATGR